MKAKIIEIEDKINELLIVLDKDIQHIEYCLSQLDELRSLVIKRDDTALSKLLDDIRAESENYRSCERRRLAIRKELAAIFGYDLEQMTLARLEKVLPEEKKTQIMEKKIKLKMLTARLKREHSGTALLLSDCARFNSLLLKSIFDLGRTETVYYNASGSAKRQTETAFVNLQF
jgi:hypothetical protein